MSDTTANNVRHSDNPDPESANNNKTNKDSRSDTRKVIRLLTVLAYMFAVSMAAIVLSLYYIFLWSPKSASRSMALTAPCIACQYISISLAAIMLSMYYLFLWQPQKSTIAQVPNTPPDCVSGNLQTNDFNTAQQSVQNYASQEQMIAETPRVLPQRIEETSPISETTEVNIDYEDANFTFTNTEVTAYS